jgi:hypothetical protein
MFTVQVNVYCENNLSFIQFVKLKSVEFDMNLVEFSLRFQRVFLYRSLVCHICLLKFLRLRILASACVVVAILPLKLMICGEG